MQPFRHASIEIPGRALVNYDLNAVFSNIMTTLVTAVRQPTRIRPMTAAVRDKWFSTAMNRLGSTDITSAVMGLFTDVKAERVKDPQIMFLQYFAEVAAALMSDPDYHDDCGEELANELTNSGVWAKSYVTDPSLGYPRPYYDFSPQIGSGMPTFGLSFGDLANYIHLRRGEKRKTDANMENVEASRRGFATTCWIWDRPAMGIQLLPSPKNKEGRDLREPLVGKMLSAQDQQRYLIAAPLLYALQAGRLWASIMEPIETYALELAMARYERDRPHLVLRSSLRAAVLARIPLHPLLDTLARLVGSQCLINTLYGRGPALLCPDTIDIKTPAEYVKSGRSNLAEQLVAAALSETYRMSALADEPSYSWARDIIKDIAPFQQLERVRASAAISTGHGYAFALELLTVWEEYVKLFPEITSALGWSAGASLALSEMEATGADFVLCNGDYMSDTPVAVLAGMRPSLSIANHRVMGMDRGISPTWNSGPDPRIVSPPDRGENGNGNGTVKSPQTAIVWSVLPVKGRITALSGNDQLAHFYIMPGMSMGEQGSEIRYCGQVVSDEIGRRIIKYYIDRSKGGYVRGEHNEPAKLGSIRTPNVIRHSTDWDTAVWTPSQPEAAQQELLDAYGTNNVDRKPEYLLFRRDGWNMRVPVKLARYYTYHWLDELGNYRGTESFDGFVLFDSHLSLPHGATGLDSLLNLMRVATPPIKAELVNTPKPPEEPTAP